MPLECSEDDWRSKEKEICLILGAKFGVLSCTIVMRLVLRKNNFFGWFFFCCGSIHGEQSGCVVEGAE